MVHRRNARIMYAITATRCIVSPKKTACAVIYDIYYVPIIWAHPPVISGRYPYTCSLGPGDYDFADFLVDRFRENDCSHDPDKARKRGVFVGKLYYIAVSLKGFTSTRGFHTVIQIDLLPAS